VTFLRPEATINARWQFRESDGARVRTEGCDHFLIDGLEVRSIPHA
jgi:hypothetical protein